MEDTFRFLIELRKRLIRCLCVFAVVLIIASVFAHKIYQYLTLPLLQHLAPGASLIAISVPAPFLIPFKSAIVASFFIAVPYFLYHCGFLSRRHCMRMNERRYGLC